MTTKSRIGSGIVIAAVAVMVLLEAPSAAAAEETKKGTSLEVVDAPKAGARVVFELAPGDKASVVGKKDKWVKVKSGGKEGWLPEESWKAHEAAASAVVSEPSSAGQPDKPAVKPAGKPADKPTGPSAAADAGKPAAAPAPAPIPVAEAARPKGSLTPPPIPKDNPMTAAVFGLADKLAVRFFDQSAKSPLRRMAVMDFDAIGETVEQKKLNDVSREMITTRLSRYREFTLIERSKLAEIRKELDMSKTGQMDPATAQHIGKLFGAQAVVVGAVAEAGAQYTVNARMVSVETGEVLIADDMQVEREGLIALSSKAIIKKTFAGMMIRSAIMPGWGQIENDQALKGYIFLGPAVAALAGAAATGVMWGRAAEDFNRVGTNYKGSATLEEAQQRFTEWTEAKSTVDTYKMATLGAVAAYAVVWGLNMADMAMNGRDIEKIDLEKIGVGKPPEQKASINVGPSGANLAVKF